MYNRKGKLIVVIMEGTSAKNASFGLSKALSERGHRIIYLAPEHDREHIEKQGFGFYAIQFPYVPDANGQGSAIWNPVNWWRSRTSNIRRLFRTRVYVNHFAEKWLRQIRPDLVLLDNKLVRFAVPLIRVKVPVINVNPNLSSVGFTGNPPVFSGLLPADKPGLLSRLKMRMAWQKIVFTQKVRGIQEKLVYSIVLGTFKYKTIPALIRESGASLSRSEYGFRLAGPELVLGPASIDFPGHAERGQRCYAGICVDETRKDVDFDSTWFDRQKPFIYCSLGTHSSHYKFTKRLYQCLFEVMEQLTGYHLLLQAEGFEEKKYAGRIPENVSVFQSVPQLQLLKRARLFITHGGFSSVREAIYYGVPMIIFPGWHDQPGNAARVVYHGIGMRGDMKNITTTRLISMIKEILDDDRTLHAVRQMQKMVLEKKEFQSAVEYIENVVTIQP